MRTYLFYPALQNGGRSRAHGEDIRRVVGAGHGRECRKSEWCAPLGMLSTSKSCVMERFLTKPPADQPSLRPFVKRMREAPCCTRLSASKPHSSLRSVGVGTTPKRARSAVSASRGSTADGEHGAVRPDGLHQKGACLIIPAVCRVGSDARREEGTRIGERVSGLWPGFDGAYG